MESPPSPTSAVTDHAGDISEYWCHQCEKRVLVETRDNLRDVVCFDCKNGFVESIPVTNITPRSASPSITSDQIDDPSFEPQFLEVLSLISQAEREEDEPTASPPPPLPQDHQPEDDFLRIELDGWENVEGYYVGDDVNQNDIQENMEEGREVDEENRVADIDTKEELTRRRRDRIRFHLREFANRPRRGRNILDWAEMLIGMEDSSIEFRFEDPESDRYIGNPEDYLDAAGYEALLQNLTESDGGRGGAPPASKDSISMLTKAKVQTEELCTVCKDMMNVGVMVTKLPCGHGYHGDCIGMWLGSRNSCPVCRFELPTDDAEYEKERTKKSSVKMVGASGSGPHEDNSGTS